MDAGKSKAVTSTNNAQDSSAVKGSTRAKGGTASDNERLVKILVAKQHAVDVLYEVKRSSIISRIMFDYCQLMEVNYKAFRFYYLGKQIDDFATPETLEMGDNEVIDCFVEQCGGC